MIVYIEFGRKEVVVDWFNVTFARIRAGFESNIDRWDPKLKLMVMTYEI